MGQIDRHIDVAVIGAGVIGLAVARSLALAQPQLKIVVIDKERHAASHASTRNSGVLHAGFYYSPDSLKAKLTARGNEMLRAFCHDTSVPITDCGKVVLARGTDEEAALIELHRRGVANGVNVELIDKNELARLEPLAYPAEIALWSPNTGVADPKLVATALVSDLQRLGVEIRLSAEVINVDLDGNLQIKGSDLIATREVVNCAGLFADRLAHRFGVGLEYEVLPFRGLYVYGDWPAGRLQRHVYPVPDSRNPFLGVHATVTADGGIKIGPTAIPGLWREHYRGFSGVSLRDFADVTKMLPRFFAHDPKMTSRLLASEAPKVLKSSIVRAAQRLVPSVSSRSFRKWGAAGVRAQLVYRRSGKLAMDFIVEQTPNSTHVLNAVSPAWTSSLAVGEYVAQKILPRLD